jgi:hypothetical protein
MDRKLFSSMFSELKNIASNTTIQTLEAYHAFTNWRCIMSNLRAWGFRSRIFNGTHDSFDLYIYKPELDVVLALLCHVTGIVRRPYYDLPLLMDIEVSDVSAPEKLEKHYYKHGKEYSLRDLSIDDALAKWNAEHDTSLTFTNTIPQ